MGFMDFKGKVNQTLFGNDVESFSQGMQKERERNVIFDYETIARDSFEFPEVAEKRLEKLMAKKGKKTDAILEYLNGDKFYKPPFVEEWLELRGASPEEMQKAVSAYEEEHGCEIKHFVENYENFLKWCHEEEEQSDGVMTPICFECGAVITAYMDKCPCCNDVFDEDEDSETETQEEVDEIRFCSNCGAKMETDSRFCPTCGKAL